MRGSCLGPPLLVMAMLGTTPLSARFARQPDYVGPPIFREEALCKITVVRPGGQSAGTAIPIPALRLGSPVARAQESFTTGGSATANMAEMARRKAAGLPFEPQIFDPAAAAMPAIFAAEAGTPQLALPYQRLPLKVSGNRYAPDGMIFAQAVSKTTGRIAALVLTLPAAPVGRPKVTLIFRSPSGKTCQPPIQVYASAMTTAQVTGLFDHRLCGWASLSGCTARSDRPRGRVLFVRQLRSGIGHEYRWMDYDLLTAHYF
ncbi:MAG: hypothetical protein V4564_16010 [Pseudomonadota bacterium]